MSKMFKRNENQLDHEKQGLGRWTRKDIDEVKDTLSAVGKGLISQLPITGPVVAELMGTVLRNRRMEKSEKLAAYTAAKLFNLDPKYVLEKMQEPEFIELLEQGVYQVSKAFLEQRIQLIAGILAGNILAENDSENQLALTYMDMLNSLTDYQVAILMAIEEIEDAEGRSETFVSWMELMGAFSEFYPGVNITYEGEVDAKAFDPQRRLGVLCEELERKECILLIGEKYDVAESYKNSIGVSLDEYTRDMLRFAKGVSEKLE